MRRLSAFFYLFLLAVATVSLTACGGNNTPALFGNPAKITVAPNSTSLTVGAFENVNAIVSDDKGTTLFASGGAASPNVTFTSSNAAALTVSNNGLVCAGTWDSLTTPVVCTPGGVGSATVTVTSGGITATSTIFVHAKIDRVDISGAPADLASCLSQGQTAQLTAKASSAGQDITATVGAPTWSIAIPDVVTIDANNVATAHNPGQTAISASFGDFHSASVPFSVCPVGSITIHVKGGTDTSLALDPSGTATLSADVLDIHQQPLLITKASASSSTGALTWSTTSPSATVVGLTTVLSDVTATSTNDATVTGSRAGTTSIVASCTPPLCNSFFPGPNGPSAGFVPVYSNIVTEKTSGTTSSTVFVTGTDTTQLIPIPTSTNTPGTTITLSNQPNSLLIGRDGARAFLGSSGGLMVVDANALTLTGTNPNVTGKVLAVAPNGRTVAVADTSKDTVFVGDATTGAFQTFNIAGVTAAAYSADGFRLYLVSPAAVTVISPGSAPRTVSVAGGVDIATHPTGSVAYIASSSAIQAVASCNLTKYGTDPAAVGASLITALASGSQVLAAAKDSLEVIDATVDNGVCPPTLSTNAPTPISVTGTPSQIIATSDGKRAFVTNDTPNLITYNAADKTAATIALTGTTASFTGAVTLDGTQLYVGAAGSTPVVHRIDLTTNQDVQQITASPTAFTPNLVAIRP